MARAITLMDEPQSKERVIYVSWFPDDDGLAAACLKKLQDVFAANNKDNFGRSVKLYANDVNGAVGTMKAESREIRSSVTDFIGLFSDQYIISARRCCKNGDPDLVAFITKRGCEEATNLTMWIFPLEKVATENIGFDDAGLPNLDFPWWHGLRDEEDVIPMPGATLDLKQQFALDVRRRVNQILAHPEGCETCSRH